jgi:hypothetical protein
MSASGLTSTDQLGAEGTVDSNVTMPGEVQRRATYGLAVNAESLSEGTCQKRSP